MEIFGIHNLSPLVATMQGVPNITSTYDMTTRQDTNHKEINRLLHKTDM